MGLYYLEKGASQRSSKVIYDRAYSAIALAKREDFERNKIFDGADCISMPRPKGSKNKVKPATQSIDFTSLIAEKLSSKEALVADIATVEENLTALKADLKTKKAELKKLDVELGKLEEQKAEVEAREAEKAKKAELEERIQQLMANGVSAAEILEKLK